MVVLFAALVAGAPALADEGGAPDEPQTQTQQAPASEEPEVSVDSQSPEQPRVSEHPRTFAQPQMFAPPPALQRRAAERSRTSWYGWQTLLSDVGAIGLWIATFVVDDAGSGSTSWQSYDTAANVLGWSGVAVYALGAPAIHLAHGSGRKAAGSLGLRVGLPLGTAIAGALVGAALCGDDDNSFVSCPVVTAALGFVAGGIAAPIVDGAVLGYEPVTPPAESRFQAAFVPSASGGTFVLGGRF